MHRVERLDLRLRRVHADTILARTLRAAARPHRGAASGVSTAASDAGACGNWSDRSGNQRLASGLNTG